MSAAVCSATGPFEVRGDRNLCPTCLQFISELSIFCANENYPQGWDVNETGSRVSSLWGVAFKHLGFDALAASAQSCCLCHVLHDHLAALDADFRRGWLGLFPRYESHYIGANERKGYFRAGFSESLDRVPWENPGVGGRNHTFRVGRLHPPVDSGPLSVPWTDPYLEELTVAPRLTLELVAQRYKDWVKTCDTDLSRHSACARRAGTLPAAGDSDLASQHETAPFSDQGVLPTRVIDLGPPGSDETPCLYVAHLGEKAPYVALSHCWGGAIPASTVQGNLEARMESLSVDTLPRNFRDAIAVTRVLGIRYLWIDSLCIVQDSPADWAAEAGRMAPLYAGAVLVLSVLEAASSDVGFLHPEADRVPRAVLNDEYAVQRVFGNVYDYLEKCRLNGRAWCMQERILARRVLHFGRQQMFWECDSYFTSEAGDMFHAQSTGHVQASFMGLRKELRTSTSLESPWPYWYKLVEEYTTRRLTVGMDKLPAVTGVAASLKRAEPMSTYVAGLWRENLAPSLVWGARYDHYDGRKTWGYGSHDKCDELIPAPRVDGRRRAPSWSWASVDGAVIFWCQRSGDPTVMLESLEVVMERGEDDLTEPQPQGVLKVRGLLAKMVYLPPTTGDGIDVGSLKDSDQKNTAVLHSCVMDTARQVKRQCYALLVYVANNDHERYFLVLDCVDGGATFERVGICKADDWYNLEGFVAKDISII